MKKEKLKKFEEHFLLKYPEYQMGNVANGDVQKYVEELNQVIKVDSVNQFYQRNKAEFIFEAIYLLKDDEITLSMAVEMEPYQLAILRLNSNIDRETRLYAELNWG
jgi:hypothetical protein